LLIMIFNSPIFKLIIPHGEGFIKPCGGGLL